MSVLDVRTVMIGHLVANALGVVVTLYLRLQNRGRFAGMTSWLAGFSLQTLGTLLMILRGTVPDIFSILLANAMLLAGAIAIVAGLTRFMGGSRSSLADGILLLAFMAIVAYFFLIRPNIEARTLVVEIFSIIVFLGAIAAWLKAGPEMRHLIARIAHVYIAMCVISLVRIVFSIIHPPATQDFFRSRGGDALILLAYQAALILLAYLLSLTVNERLIGELRFQEEKYAKAFRSSPYSITLTDEATGKIIDVNQGFVRILGFSREEAIGRTTMELRLWENADNRRQAVEALEAGGKVFEMEFRFRKKSGDLITGLWSAEQIIIGGRRSIFASLNDISIRKRALESLGESVKEKELLMKELKHRVKNSLSIVSSLLGLSRDASADAETKTVLNDLRTRVGSVSLVYEQLEWTGRVDTVDLRTYVQNLTDTLVKSYAPTDGRILVKADLAESTVDAKTALPLGLILNELVINAFKYAYPDGRKGEIRVDLKPVTGGLCLTVSDDGVGRTPGVVSPGGAGTGSVLVETLADQIGARVSRPPGPGTTVIIHF